MPQLINYDARAFLGIAYFGQRSSAKVEGGGSVWREAGDVQDSGQDGDEKLWTG